VTCKDTCFSYNCETWEDNGYTCTELQDVYGCDCGGCECAEWQPQSPPSSPSPPPSPGAPPSPPPAPATCDADCFGYDCDFWVENLYTCPDLESAYGCDCSGCMCGHYPPPTPEPSIPPSPSPPPPAPVETCDPDCFGFDCNFWVDNSYTCDELESAFACDCSGCSCTGNNSPPPAPATCPETCYSDTCDGWVLQGYTCTELENVFGCTCAGCECDARVGGGGGGGHSYSNSVKEIPAPKTLAEKAILRKEGPKTLAQKAYGKEGPKTLAQKAAMRKVGPKTLAQKAAMREAGPTVKQEPKVAENALVPEKM